MLTLNGKLRNYLINCFVDDQWITASIKNNGAWKDQVLLGSVFEKVFKSKPINCMDIGANIGATTLQMVDSGCSHVAAVEAVFGKFLASTIKVNNLQDKVEIFSKAVSNERKLINLNLVTSNPGASGSIRESKQTHTVQAERLDYFVGDAVYDLVKIDIEGDEKFLYADLITLMSAQKIKSVFLEVHFWDRNTVGVLAQLKKMNMAIVSPRTFESIADNLSVKNKHEHVFIYNPALL